jgi:hypothetical protein
MVSHILNYLGIGRSLAAGMCDSINKPIKTEELINKPKKYYDPG